MEDQKEGGREYTPETRYHRYDSQKLCVRGLSMGDTFCGVHQYIGAYNPYQWLVCLILTYTHSGIFLATLNTAYRWSKRSVKKNILSIAKVVTFEVTPKFWGMKDRRKWCKERTRWTRIKALPVGIDVMFHCSFFINFCASYSSCCCIIVVKYPSLIIMFS